VAQTSPVLFVDDGSLDREMVIRFFREHGEAQCILFVSTGKAGLEMVQQQPLTALFVNQSLPDMTGLEFIRELNRFHVRMPVVIILAPNSEESVVLTALREGAYECIMRGTGDYDSLPLVLARTLARYQVERERTELETVITESYHQWLAIIDGITDFIFMTDSEGTIIKTNRALARVFGKHPRELIGEKCFEFIGIGPEAWGEMMMSLPCTEERSINEETYLISSFPLNYNGRALTINVMKNVTEMRRLKDQLYHSDKLASLGLLVSGVAHEINNPLTGIIAFTELLKMKGFDEETSRELQKILESGERCKKIVENLLTFSRQKTPTRSLESINDIIDRAIDLRSYWLRLNEIEVVREFGSSQSVFVDSQQIQQVVLNILLNAEQAITSARKGHRRITFATRYDRDSHKVIIRISDNGPGISPNVLPKIFDPFFTTKPVGIGTGLGLSISHGIISEHGGVIRVESSEGEGATFIVELPTGIGNIYDVSACTFTPYNDRDTS
jgi:PAS domain S-box-containing protein